MNFDFSNLNHFTDHFKLDRNCENTWHSFPDSIIPFDTYLFFLFNSYQKLRHKNVPDYIWEIKLLQYVNFTISRY